MISLFFFSGNISKYKTGLIWNSSIQIKLSLSRVGYTSHSLVTKLSHSGNISTKNSLSITWKHHLNTKLSHGGNSISTNKTLSLGHLGVHIYVQNSRHLETHLQIKLSRLSPGNISKYKTPAGRQAADIGARTQYLSTSGVEHPSCHCSIL